MGLTLRPEEARQLQRDLCTMLEQYRGRMAEPTSFVLPSRRSPNERCTVESYQRALATSSTRSAVILSVEPSVESLCFASSAFARRTITRRMMEGEQSWTEACLALADRFYPL
jgi:hypothetical protein